MRTYIVRILNMSTLSEVRKSNFEYVNRVIRSERLVRKSKVHTVYGEVRKSRFDCTPNRRYQPHHKF